MHYKNGREAKEGDSVIFKTDNGGIKGGIAHSLMAHDRTCNCTVSYIIPGTVLSIYGTLKEMYHAEDAFLEIESLASDSK